MAWTTPYTWLSELVTVAKMNEQIRDNLVYLKAPTSPTSPIGYGAGAGGAVTQATNKSTAVTLDTVTGQITMNAAALASGASVTFQLANTILAGSNSMVVVAHAIGGMATGGSYRVDVGTMTGTGFITVTNVTGGSLAEAVVIQFAILGGTLS